MNLSSRWCFLFSSSFLFDLVLNLDSGLEGKSVSEFRNDYCSNSTPAVAVAVAAVAVAVVAVAAAVAVAVVAVVAVAVVAVAVAVAVAAAALLLLLLLLLLSSTQVFSSVLTRFVSQPKEPR